MENTRDQPITGGDEGDNYNEIVTYLTRNEYPQGATKAEKGSIRKRAKRFCMVDGLLHYTGGKDGVFRQVITEKARKANILEALHDGRAGGCHFGRDRTYDKVCTRFYWKGIMKDVDDWVKHCDVCQRTKRKFDRPAPTLHPISVSDTWNKVGIDIIELPLSSQGNRYCVTLTDYFSKWPEAEAFPTKEATNVAEFLYCTCLRHGFPEEIISDQGREFCNKMIDRLEELTGFRHNVTSAYHPQANGLDERFNQTLKAQLQKMVNEHQDDWDTILDEILFAYRTSRHASSKFTPFLLMYGRETRLPIELAAKQSSRSSSDESMQSNVPFEETIQKLLDVRKQVHNKARANIKKAQDNQKRYYDAKHNTDTHLKVGDEVLIENKRNDGRKGGKLDIRFPGGPYEIIEDLGKGRFRVRGPDGLVRKQVVNNHRLKLWRDPSEGRLKKNGEEKTKNGEKDKKDQDVEAEKRGSSEWMQVLGLTKSDIMVLSEGKMLLDTHMFAAHKLIREQFHVDGCQSTLLCQNKGFSAVYARAVQIFYNGHAHWVATFFDGSEIFLFDSLTHGDLPSSLEEQIAAVYATCCSKDGLLMITKVGVQQQKGMMDCGLFAIAFAYHAAQGDNVSNLEFDQPRMRQHLLDCFQSAELKPFPMITAAPRKRRSKHVFIHLNCTICLMPDSYDVRMIECDVCAKWFHFKCVGLKRKCPRRWVCRCCRDM